MAYISYNELIARYPQFTKWHEGNVSLVSSISIYFAEADLNSRLSQGFTVPFTPTAPPVIKDITCDLAYAKMMKGIDPEKYSSFYDDVVDRIDRIISGQDVIVSDSGTQILTSIPAGEIWSSTMEYHSTHSMLDAESPYTMVSSENLYAAENERS